MKKKLIEATAANLVAAIEKFYKVTGAFTVDCMDGYGVSAQLQQGPFEKAFPNQGNLVDRRPCEGEWLYQKELVVGGVKFFCLLTEEEVEVCDDIGKEGK